MAKTAAKTKSKGGRPPKFDKVETLFAEIKKYLDSCKQSRTLPNKAGLCVFLHITRETYNQYKQKPEFSDALKQTERYIEDAWVQRLGGNSPTGAIFYLKNAFQEDYRDRHEHTGKDGEPVVVKIINYGDKPSA